MSLSKLAMNTYVDGVVAYEFCNNNVIRYKSKHVGESDKLIWEIDKATSIEFIGAIPHLKLHPIISKCTNKPKYTPLGEIFIADDIDCSNLEKKIKEGYFIVGKLPPGMVYKFWISPQIKQIEPAYEKQTL